ncbi:uncharacterized protein LOC100164970 [Acyrthosiphon pisum]|uniref:ACYPI005945 protein n=1 Tax=Acyrthosiphon pisum TaxID=7029 RepID=C4WS95_ACYPI|nr:uncharacterized protein LOC100164970 [Acyrthosiphon pisum]BAH70765.1 ACYPI005945 [Acyrthosiphon pisum]|eukprot:NP_001280354.1 uncharacterized protein LOC100164970 [Acyrthosiphon pisum]
MALDLNQLPALPAKTTFVLHLILITWSVQGRWSPDSYLFYNIMFMGCVLWAMHQTENEKPAQLAISVKPCNSMFRYCHYLLLFSLLILVVGNIQCLFVPWQNLVLRFVTLSVLSRMCIEQQ